MDSVPSPKTSGGELGAGDLRIGAFIVGAQKSGTTTLARVLAEHPDVCLARDKECHLFDEREVQRNGVSSGQIDNLFPHRLPGQLLLDATPSYLYLPGCIEALLRHSPDARMVVILRRPAERAVSHYGHEVRGGRETRPILWALVSERRRLRRDADELVWGSAHRQWSYVDRGRYDVQLHRLLGLSSSVHVVLFEELLRSPQAVIDGVCDFLGVGRMVIGELPIFNDGKGERHRVARLLARLLLGRSPVRTERLLGLPRGALR